MDLSAAKAQSLAVEKQVAGDIPAADVASVDQLTSSLTLFDCPGGFRWPGRTTVTLASGVDPEQVIASLGPQWSGKKGWTVTRDTTPDGLPRVQLVNADGAEFLISIEDHKTTIQVESRSACFALPGGRVPGMQY